MTDVWCPSTPPLRPRQLHEPLLIALGQATNLTPGTFVQHRTVLGDVIREAGFDPDDLPAGWSRTKRSNGGKGAGLDRNISLAFRYAYRDKREPLTLKGPKPGMWGLTPAGVEAARAVTPSPTPSPRPRQLHEPLLITLGKATNLTSGVFVQHRPILDDVIREAGFDPDNLPAGWSRTRRNGGKGAGLNRNITLAFRYAYRDRREPLTLKGPKPGLWGLTPAGVEAARALIPRLRIAAARKRRRKVGKGPNVTSRWFTKALKPERGEDESELMRRMRAALSHRLPVSARRGLVEDHVNNFMVRVIRRDAFRKTLDAGRTMPLSKVVAYCVNSGRTDARDMGTEPVCREMYGARTERERREAKAATLSTAFDNQPLGAWDTDGSIMPAADMDSVVINDIATDFERVWGRIEGIVAERKPQAWERYSGIIAMRARGLTTKEIAQAEGVSRNRAASMLAEARRCVREGAHKGDLNGYLFA